MADLLEDTRNRPVVFQTRAEPGAHRLRPHVRVLAGTTLVVAALAGAAGITFGGSALWSVLGNTSGSDNAPPPLWIPPPKGITAPHTDDHQPAVGRDAATLTEPPSTSHHPSATHVPGADDSTHHDSTTHTVTTAPTEQSGGGGSATTSQQEPEPGDDHHRGAGGGGPHGGGTSGRG
jgi:hypothetical protein